MRLTLINDSNQKLMAEILFLFLLTQRINFQKIEIKKFLLVFCVLCYNLFVPLYTFFLY